DEGRLGPPLGELVRGEHDGGEHSGPDHEGPAAARDGGGFSGSRHQAKCPTPRAVPGTRPSAPVGGYFPGTRARPFPGIPGKGLATTWRLRSVAGRVGGEVTRVEQVERAVP